MIQALARAGRARGITHVLSIDPRTMDTSLAFHRAVMSGMALGMVATVAVTVILTQTARRSLTGSALPDGGGTSTRRRPSPSSQDVHSS